MATKTLTTPMSFYGQTARSVDFANRPKSAGWKVAAWSGVVLWLALMYCVIACWYVCLIPFLWIVIPLRAHRRGQRKADQLAEKQNSLTQQQIRMQELQVQDQLSRAQREMDVARQKEAG